MLIVTSLSEDAAIRRIVGTLSSRLRIQKILRPRPQHTVSLSFELVIFFFRILCCHRRFSLFLKCKYLYKFMTLNIMIFNLFFCSSLILQIPNRIHFNLVFTRCSLFIFFIFSFVLKNL